VRCAVVSPGVVGRSFGGDCRRAAVDIHDAALRLIGCSDGRVGNGFPRRVGTGDRIFWQLFEISGIDQILQRPPLQKEGNTP
jgi:hypothetical protein